MSPAGYFLCAQKVPKEVQETIKTTEMLALNIVNAFSSNGGGNRGVGQAKAVIFFVVVAAISIIQLQASRRKEVQQ